MRVPRHRSPRSGADDPAGPRRRNWMSWATAVLIAMLLSGCAILGDTGEVPQNALNPSPGTVAESQDQLWDLVLRVAAVVFVLVQALILYTVLRFRSRGNTATAKLPKQVAGNTRVELLWTAIPALILAIVAVPTVRTIFELATIDADALNVRVIAKQYYWEFEYTDPETQGVITATQLNIPTGREIHLDMQSVSASATYNPPPATGEAGEIEPTGPVALGVIHSFWVPELAGKTDVVPGHTREMKIIAQEEGLFVGQCAEFCGLSHPNMKISVVAQSPEAFMAWIADQQQPAQVIADGGAAQRGQELFTSQTCVGCHAIDGYPSGGVAGGAVVPENEQARIGPNLTHFAGRDTFAGGIYDAQSDDDLTAWLTNPQAQKPGSQMPNLGLEPDEIADLIAYLRTLD